MLGGDREDVAAAERVRPQSMAQTVGDLEAEGLVSRRPDPDDGRRSLVSLTPDGVAALQADRSHREGWLVAAMEQLTPEEQDTLARAVVLLRRISES